MISCVLMCGGKGSRLKTDPTIKVEKPLLELKNRTLIEHMIYAVQNTKKNFKVYAAVSKNTKNTKEFLKSRYCNEITLIETTGNGFSNDYLIVLQFFKDKENKAKKGIQDFVDDKILFLPSDLPLISSKTLDEITDLYQDTPSIAIVVAKELFVHNNLIPSPFTIDINKVDYCYTGISILDFHAIKALENIDQIGEVPMIMNNPELVYNINTVDDLKKAEEFIGL